MNAFEMKMLDEANFKASQSRWLEDYTKSLTEHRQYINEIKKKSIAELSKIIKFASEHGYCTNFDFSELFKLIEGV